MLLQTQGIIYLANQRICTQLGDWYQSYQNFDSASISSNLLAFNDETLKATHSLNVSVQVDSIWCFLPLVGALEISHSQNTKLVEVGQVYMFEASQNTTFEITNPYEKGLINFLRIQLKISDLQSNLGTQITEFSLANYPNQLISLNELENYNLANLSLNIGKFGGREECVFSPQNPSNKVFTFVIAGAFEVQNRLLEPRDSLLLCNLPSIEFEALSNEAIILFLEIANDSKIAFKG